MELIKLKKSGFHNFLFAKGSTRALCAFKDGSVGVYDLGVRKWEFLGEPGHTETIFDCQFKTSSPDTLATASFDGTVKLWNIKSMKCLDTLNAGEGIVYCIAWAPGNDDRLIAATSKGPLVMWDTKRGQLLLRYDHHKDAVYRCAWNPLDPSLIASCSRDGYCVVFKAEGGTATHRLRMPKPAYGCDWSSLQKNLLVTGCQDGVVRVYDISKKSDPLIKTLKGHTERVFNTVWSPLLPNMVMSGSDDKTIRVWNVETERVHVLTGHTENVRALVWHPEIPYMVLTGSWDGTIRIWDFRAQACLSVVWDHHADVYGLACHPQRPFVFVSSSRDTTLRVWTMAREAARARVLMLFGNTWNGITGEVDAVMNGEALLAGRASRDLVLRVKGARTEAQRAQVIFDFFSPPNGVRDLWDLVVGIEGKVETKDKGDNAIVRNDELVQNTLQKAQELELVRNATFATGAAVGSARKEDRLALAAHLYLKLGNLEKHCEILTELGQWEKALAIAPSVSIGYWRDLAARYAEYLSNSESADSEAYLVATGNIPKLVDFYVKRGQFDDALLVAQLPISHKYSSINTGPTPSLLPPLSPSLSPSPVPTHSSSASASSSPVVPPPPVDPSTSSSSNLSSSPLTTIIKPSALSVNIQSNPPRSPTLPSSNNIANFTANNQLIYQISNKKADQYYYSARPVMAACSHLASADTQHAIHKLLKGNEIELAAMLAKVLRVGPADHAFQLLAMRCENLGLWDLAVDIIRMTRRPVQELSGLCVRAQSADKVDVVALYQKAELRPREAYIDTAKEMEKQGRTLDAIRCFLLGGDHDVALKLSLSQLRALVAQETWDPNEAHFIIQMMGSAKLDTATIDKVKRAELLAYAALTGAYLAIWKGYYPIVPRMLATARKMVSQASAAATQAGTPSTALFAPLIANIGAAQVQYNIATRSTDPPGEDIPQELRATALAYATHFSSPSSSSSLPPLNANLIIVAGSNLPARVRAASESLVSKKPILGPEVVLDDNSVLSLSEALMWSQVNPFSPSCSGKFLSPY